MARIALRAYNREVENLIERGQIEEAIAHCKNILRQFPKHIETYRLLGKAFLESQRYTEAADILQRVLSVLPDDFVSQLGMSIIREDEGNLDASIWHMERAYEVQPFNRAVQDELRRLYGRRDGAEPPRVRLTRGALVRMYARGDLYPQAIAEIRAALAEDHNRIDLLVLLARMYFQSGQKLEATEICSSLISKLPFCIEANRILMEVLPETSHAEDARVFQQRLYSLDPYAAFLSPNAPTSQQVPDQTVMVEHVDWQPSQQETQAPDWARTIGVQWEDTKEEVLPDWLNNIHTPEAPSSYQVPAVSETAQSPVDEPEPYSSPENAAPQEDLLPDFLKGAGWAPSDGTVEEAPVIYEDEPIAPATEELAEAEIPDWLQSLAPDQSAQPSTEPSENAGLDWLDGILPPAAAVASETPQGSDGSLTLDAFDAPIEALPAEGIPDWLQELKSETTPDSSVSNENPAGVQAQSAVEEPAPEAGLLPAWLRGEDPIIDQTNVPIDEPPAVEETSFPWLDAAPQSDVENHPESASEDFPWLAETLQPLQEPAEAIPPMMNLSEETIASSAPTVHLDPEGAQPIVETLPSQPMDSRTSELIPSKPAEMEPPAIDQPLESAETTPPELDDMDSALAWLEGLAARQGADADSLKISAPEDRSETPPDWIQSQAEIPQSEPEVFGDTEMQSPIEEVSTSEPLSEVDALPGWLSESAPITNETSASEQEGIPGWLQISTPEETSPSLSSADEAAGTPIASTEEAYLPPVLAEEISTQTEETQAVPEDMDSALAWLEGLAARQGADADSLKISAPEDRTETPPDWLAQVPSEAPTPLIETLQFEETTASIPTDEFKQPDSDQIPLDHQSEDQSVLMETDSVEPPASQISVMEGEPDQPVEFAPVLPADEVIEPIVPNPSPTEMNPDDAFAWLESLAARQGAEEETLITPPEEHTEVAPSTAEEAEGLIETPIELPTQPVSTISEPVETIEETPVVEELSELKANIEAATPEKVGSAEVEIPDWLRSYEEDQQQQTPAWDPSVQSLTTETVPDEVIPAWMNEEPEAQSSVSSTPGSAASPAPADELEAWLEGLDNQPAVPTQSTASAGPETGFEWIPEQETIPSEVKPEPVAPVSQPVEPLAASGSPLDHARAALTAGNLDAAVELYSQLINSDRFINEAIQDLHTALTQHSKDATLWLTYGDACIRGNKVQDALEAYTTAENLLQ
jgi:cytochrome c-type biogenesis protein CcmH/NrfG